MSVATKFKVPVETWKELVSEAETRLRQLDRAVEKYESLRNEVNRFIGEDDDNYEKTLNEIDKYLQLIHEKREKVVENINTLNDMIGVAHIFKGTSEMISIFEKGFDIAGI